MRKLAEVEDAKALMTEAMGWSVVKWLSEKKRVRKSADLANAGLDRLDQEVKARWNDELKAAYSELGGNSGGGAQRQHQQTSGIDPQVKLLAQRLKESDDEAYRVRMEAEDTFDEAEKKLSTRLAREGCRKAIDSWDLHEQAIRKSEAAIGATKA
jgi:biopolymer transport protein ExbB/TolQ